MKKVTILRGIPGCGKTTYTHDLRPYPTVVSADNYFYDDKGEYNFNPSLLPKAHAYCFNNFLKALKGEAEHIVVDNTNIEMWEFSNYVEAAELAGYEVEIIEFRVRILSYLKLCHSRNEHGVSLEACASMALRFQPHPQAKEI